MRRGGHCEHKMQLQSKKEQEEEAKKDESPFMG